MKNVCKKYCIQVYFKGARTIKGLLVAPKDKDHITKKSGIIYRYKCGRVQCDEDSKAESSRTSGERYREHLKTTFPLFDHFSITGDNTTLGNFSIVGSKDKDLMRLIKESIYTTVNNPSLNKNADKYHLPIYKMRFCSTAQNLK